MPDIDRQSQYACLSPARKRIVDLLTELQFGRLQKLVIAGGEPQFYPAPEMIQTIKLPVETSLQPTPPDFVLKQPLRDLFRCFDQWQNGVIQRLDFRFGLPCKVEITVHETGESDRRSDGSPR